MSETDRRRWLALYTLCAGVLMIVLDATIVNVALPTIAVDLRFAPTDLSWVVNAYLIAFGGLLLLAGRIGDLVGQRRVFLTGLTVFVAASLACAAATTPWLLVAARLVQGVGGALTSAVVLGMIVSLFPDPAECAKAIGVYGFVASAGGSIGLLAGGVLTSALDWRWIFLVNVPVGIATAVCTLRYVDPSPRASWRLPWRCWRCVRPVRHSPGRPPSRPPAWCRSETCGEASGPGVEHHGPSVTFVPATATAASLA
jgi:MFS family permease